MKRILLFCLLVAGVLTTNAQTIEPCGTTKLMEEYYGKNPEAKKAHESLEEQLRQIAEDAISHRVAGTPYTIPCVVHIIHTGQAQGVSVAALNNVIPNPTDAQVRTAFDNVNADYNKRSNVTRYTGNDSTGIKLCLATKDPSGTSFLNGCINRYNGALAATWTAAGFSAAAASANATAYNNNGVKNSTANGIAEADLSTLVKWPIDKYYNIYIVTEIDGSNNGAGGGSYTAGFAYFPPGGMASPDRAIMIPSSFSATDVSTFDHEMGHALNLYHTFRGAGGAEISSAGSGVSTTTNCPTESSCGADGDFCCDIPLSKSMLQFSPTCVADGTANPCQAATTYAQFQHNYMNYGGCPNGFSPNQTTRMRSTLASNAIRINMVSPTNLTACGCDGTNKPYAEFSAATTTPCLGIGVQFTDQSLYAPTSWTWSFSPATVTYTGGTNSSSQNPIVIFNASGSYDVTLTATNTYGFGTTTKTAYIIPTTGAAVPFIEGFEAVTFPPTGWTRTSADSPDGSAWDVTGVKQWERKATSGNGTSTASAAMNHFEYAYNIGTTDVIISKAVSLSGLVTPKLTFKVAHQYYNNPANYDTLSVYISSDCGATFGSFAYRKSGPTLATKGSNSSTSFVPAASGDWRTETVDLTSYAGGIVIVKFETRNGYGNNIFVDDINIDESPTAAVTIAITSGTNPSCTGSSVTFTATPTNGGTTPTYQWKKNNTNIAGATSVTYTTSGLVNGDLITCVMISNLAGVSGSPATSNGITMTINSLPTTANAGTDQAICATTATLAGNTATVGTGTWTLVSGTGTITTPSSPTSGLTALGVGANTFRWTISNGACTSSADDVIITRSATPTTANAGTDQAICATTATLAGNTATVGTGTWTLVSGTGTITTPSSPTSALTALGVGANTFRWTISNGACTSSADDVIITRSAIPTTANAGTDQAVCATTATLAGNTAAVGTGTWTLVSGTGTITTPSSNNSGVTGLGVGANTFRWTISNGSCTSSTDDVIITRDAVPTTSAAGTDQAVCGTTATLAGNNPTIGTGAWTVITGSATVTSPSSYNSGVTGLSVGTNTFRWTISNGSCTSSTDDITITRDAVPTTSAAGIDQAVCGTTATLAGNNPSVGTGTWTVITGSATVTSPSSYNSGVTGLSVGTNTFRWTISNGSCTSSTDDITITRDAVPTTSAAGTDQSVCASTATLAGNNPTIGTGAWTVITGSATVTSPSSYNSGVTGLSVGTNTFRWTISNGSCTSSTDDITITRDAVPTTSAAGTDQSVCGTTATLAGNNPGVGTGTWTLVGGTGTITSPSSYNSGVTGLGLGANTFRWTISNGTCTSSTDDVIITRDAAPTTSAAGTDQTICATTATLGGNNPATGTGTWTLISGSGSITTPSSSASGVTGLGVGANTFRWTISNGSCTSSTDDVTITRDDVPTAAAAGTDQDVCSTSAILAGNNPTVGAGTWTLVSGAGTITSSSSYNSDVTGLGTGANTFRWTTSNGTCPSSNDDVIINNVIPITSAISGPASACDNQTGVGYSVTNTAGSTYNWSVPSGATITSGSGTNSILVDFGTTSGNVSVTETNSFACVGPTVSLSVTVTSAGTASVSISVTGGSNPICTGDPVTFTATPTNGGTPTYQWQVNGGNVGTDSPTYSYTPVNNDQVTVIMTSSLSCATGSPATSNIVTMTVDALPTTSAAGTDQTICSSFGTLAGNTPTVGVGTWTLVSGSGSITTPSDPNSGVTGLGVGANTFRWTISNGSCIASIDDVTITREDFPTTSAAGADQTVCATTATLAGNTPTVGAGTWTLVSGSGSITTLSDPNSGVTGLGVGSNTFRWTISNGSCTSSTDDVTITRDDVPTVAAAGTDQDVCSTSATLGGNNPTVGAGTWTLVSGSGSITTLSDPNSGVTGLGTGANIFRWTTSNGTCPSSNDDVIINNVIPVTSSISGPTTICDNQTGVSYSVTNTAGSTYNWSVPSGATITSGAGTNSIIVDFGTTSGNVSVTEINSFACAGPTVSLAITLVPPGPAGVSISITGGSNPICTGNTVAFTAVPTNGGAPSYQWQVNGSNVGTDNPTFSYTSVNNDQVTVIMTSSLSCATGSPATSNTETMIVDALPTSSAAGTDQNVCSATAVLAGNTPTAGTGTWTLISGSGSITTPSSPTSGVTGLSTGTNTFRWTITNGTCGSSADDVDIILGVPQAASVSIALTGGTNPTCAGDLLTFTATPVNGGTPAYQWQKNSVDIFSETNPTYTVAGLANGDVITCVMTSNLACATGSPATSNSITMNVNPAPTQPIITQSSDTLSSTAAVSYQWILNGGNISGANSQTFIATAAGNYQVLITDANGCTSLSSVFPYTPVGINFLNSEEAFRIFPNPFQENAFLQVSSQWLKVNAGSEFKLFNVLGKEMMHFAIEKEKTIIPGKDLANGVYFYKLTLPNQKEIKGRLILTQ